MSELRLNTVTDKDTGKGVNVDALHHQNTQLVRNLGPWKPGLVFENKTDYATYNNQAIVPREDTTLPYTTQGSNPTDGPDGGLVIPFPEVTRSDVVLNVASISELLSVQQAGDVFKVNVTAYHDGWSAMNETPKGGGVFVWGVGRHNGGTFIDPERTFPTNWGDKTQLTSWFADSGEDTPGLMRVYSGHIDAAWFGALADGVSDDTMSLQKSFDYASESGNGACKLLSGTHIISISNSINSYACLVVPKNLTICGKGKALTTVTRPNGERAVDGMLLVNKGFDKNLGDYEADGGITFEHFTITDGANAPSRNGGDLIGLGNTSNIDINNLHFGVHDQHGVDVAGVHNCHIHDCTGYNTASGAYNRSSAVQIDGAAGGMIGQFRKELPSIEVLVENCSFKTDNSRELLHVGHKPAHHGLNKAIKFINNTLDGAYKDGQFLIYNDPNAGFDGLEFVRNTLIANHPNSYTLNLAFNSSGELNNVLIENNTIKGLFRVGIYVGGTGDIGEPKFKNFRISGNVVEQESSEPVGRIYGIGADGLVDSKVLNNTVYTKATYEAPGCCGISLFRNKRLEVKNNNIAVKTPNVTTLSSGLNIFGIEQDYQSGPYNSYFDISNNVVDQTDVRYGIVVTTKRSGFDSAFDSGVISGNRFLGQLKEGAHSLFDDEGFSTMDNGGVSVIMPNDDKVMTLEPSKIHTVSNYGGVKSYQGKVKLEAYLKTGRGFQQINNMVFGGNAYGVVFSNITAGSFSLRTGDGGVTGLLDDGASFTYVPIARGSVSIKAYI